MCSLGKAEFTDLIKATISRIVSFAVIGILIEEKGDNEHKTSTHISDYAIDESGNLLVSPSSASLLEHREEHSAV